MPIADARSERPSDMLQVQTATPKTTALLLLATVQTMSCHIPPVPDSYAFWTAASLELVSVSRRLGFLQAHCTHRRFGRG